MSEDAPRLVTPLGREPYNTSEQKCVDIFTQLRFVKSIWTRYEHGGAVLTLVVDDDSPRALTMVQNAYADLVRWHDAVNGTRGLESENTAYWAVGGATVLPAGRPETRAYIARMMPSCIWRRFDLFGPDGGTLL